MKRNIFTKLRLILRRCWTVLVFAVAISNFVMSCSVSRMTRPQYVYTTTTNEIFYTSVVTQFISSASTSSSLPLSDSPSSSDSFSRNHDSSTYHYRYMLVGGRKCVELFGRICYVGSRTSYGRIVDIFPDRILLDDGSFIVNSNLEGKPNDGHSIKPTFVGSRHY